MQSSVVRRLILFCAVLALPAMNDKWFFAHVTRSRPVWPYRHQQKSSTPTTARCCDATDVVFIRPKVSILAVTPDQQVSRRLCLLWGAHSVLSKDVNSYEEMVDRATKTALTEEFARPAQHIVVVAGIPFGEAGTTNNLRVVQIR